MFMKMIVMGARNSGENKFAVSRSPQPGARLKSLVIASIIRIIILPACEDPENAV